MEEEKAVGRGPWSRGEAMGGRLLGSRPGLCGEKAKLAEIPRKPTPQWLLLEHVG